MKKNKGITLIALIITIIVMLILVAVSINILVDSDLIGTAEQTVEKWNEVADKEKEDLDSLSGRIEDILKDQCKHEYEEWETTKEATCTEVGSKKAICTKCNKEVTEVIELLPHSEVTDAAVSATCTEAGLTEGSHCSVCNTVITAQEVVEATGHQNTTTINASASYTGDTYCNDCSTTIATGSEIILTFTINGTTYNAKGGMTWEQWFTSSYNTTGETEGTIKDSEGNEVALSAVIVDGTAYEVSFAKLVRVSFPNGSEYSNEHYDGYTVRIWVSLDGVNGTWDGNDYIVPEGTTLTVSAEASSKYYAIIFIYGEYNMTESNATYTFTVTQNTTVKFGVGTDDAEIYLTEE